MKNEVHLQLMTRVIENIVQAVGMKRQEMISPPATTRIGSERSELSRTQVLNWVTEGTVVAINVDIYMVRPLSLIHTILVIYAEYAKGQARYIITYRLPRLPR